MKLQAAVMGPAGGADKGGYTMAATTGPLVALTAADLMNRDVVTISQNAPLRVVAELRGATPRQPLRSGSKAGWRGPGWGSWRSAGGAPVPVRGRPK